jgi:hypothetical protein
MTALALAALVAVPTLTTTVNAANDEQETIQSRQNHQGTYRGYPLEDWYRPDDY